MRLDGLLAASPLEDLRGDTFSIPPLRLGKAGDEGCMFRFEGENAERGLNIVSL